MQGNENYYLKISTWKCISVREMIVADVHSLIPFDMVRKCQGSREICGGLLHFVCFQIEFNENFNFNENVLGYDSKKQSHQ